MAPRAGSGCAESRDREDPAGRAHGRPRGGARVDRALRALRRGPRGPLPARHRDAAGGDHRRDPATLRELLGAAGGELTRLLPELAPRVPDLAGPSSADAETERYRLFEAVRGWLVATVRHGPLLAVVDDLHWGTGSTVAMLAHLARAPLDGPLCVLLTLRDTRELPEGLVDLVDHLAVHPAGRVLPMAGLDVTAAAQLLGPSDDLAALVGETAGNPLLLQARASPGGGDVAAAVRRRTSELAPRVRSTLAGAAVAGTEFAVSVLATALEVDELDLVDDLDQAVTARLLDDTGGDTYRFTHALVRDALRASLTVPRPGPAARPDRHGDGAGARRPARRRRSRDRLPPRPGRRRRPRMRPPGGRAPAGRSPPGRGAALVPGGHRAPPTRPRPARPRRPPGPGPSC